MTAAVIAVVKIFPPTAEFSSVNCRRNPVTLSEFRRQTSKQTDFQKSEDPIVRLLVAIPYALEQKP
jgi:hypothetical protein